ncbi:MAG: hypothetical protein ACRC4W_02020 [Treponemataceae bacterium]
MPFTIDEKIKEEISKTFSINKDSIDEIEKAYKELSAKIPDQYLAHMVRVMEQKIRETTDNPFFQIHLEPMTDDTKLTKVCCATHQPKCYFTIAFPKNLEKKQLRICIAHELGHLYLVELANATTDTQRTKESNMEPVSTIFAFFAIMDKNQFYEKNIKNLKHRDKEETLADFVHLFLKKKK